MKFIALTLAMALAACNQVNNPTTAPSAGQGADRSAWRNLAPGAQAEHARALQMALETGPSQPFAWSGDGASGEITVLGTSDLNKSPVCRGFSDTLVQGDATTTQRSAACWVNSGWVYLEPGLIRPVLGPAFASGARIHEVRRRTTLAQVARRSGTKLAVLRQRNPSLPKRLNKGTLVLLP